ncbi:MAG: hypothetical protein Q7T05_03245, partial [Dehalococcoidia bacterium]|nr:hypothetical protein [Dehalococcoidia bacterium]
MHDNILRVVVASEHPEFRQMLAGVAEREAGVVVVGQADNAVKALELARRLRPEVAIVDRDLPYIAGVDSVRLSRMSGLDTAVDISRATPRVATMLVAQPERVASAQQISRSEPELWVYGDSGAAGIPVRLRDLIGQPPATAETVFGGVRLREIVSVRNRLTEIADKAVLGGGLAILGGLALMVTIILAGAGVALAGAGVAVLTLGIIARLAASARRG